MNESLIKNVGEFWIGCIFAALFAIFHFYEDELISNLGAITTYSFTFLFLIIGLYFLNSSREEAKREKTIWSYIKSSIGGAKKESDRNQIEAVAKLILITYFALQVIASLIKGSVSIDFFIGLILMVLVLAIKTKYTAMLFVIYSLYGSGVYLLLLGITLTNQDVEITSSTFVLVVGCLLWLLVSLVAIRLTEARRIYHQALTNSSS